MYIYIYIYIHTYTYIYTHVDVYITMYVRIFSTCRLCLGCLLVFDVCAVCVTSA